MHDSEQIPRKRGLSHLITVFQWLRKNHVERIIKVMVIDDEDPPHADSSIEEALSGFQVEIWDWKRLDLSTEVIYNSTNVVKEISLYSSGNNSVLMGWASEQGLPNKDKFPKVFGLPSSVTETTSTQYADALAIAQGYQTVHSTGRKPITQSR